MNKRISKRMTREERREQILDEALGLFIDKGYNGSTTIDIAKAAGISEVTLFRYFDSKKQIFTEAIAPILINSLKDSLDSSKDLNGIDKIKFILKDRIKFTTDHSGVIKLILMESQINPEIADFDFINQISSLLKDAIRGTDIDLEDEDFTIRLLMGSILSFLYLPRSSDEEIDSYVKNLMDKIRG